MKLVLWCDICKEEHEISISRPGINHIEIQGKLCLCKDKRENIPESVKRKLKGLRIVREHSIESIVNRIVLPDFSHIKSYDRDNNSKRESVMKHNPMRFSDYYNKLITRYRLTTGDGFKEGKYDSI